MPAGNAGRPDDGRRAAAGPPRPVGETLVVLSVLHFPDGTASGTLHVAFNGTGHLATRPKILATMLRDHADSLDTGLIVPPSGRS